MLQRNGCDDFQELIAWNKCNEKESYKLCKMIAK